MPPYSVTADSPFVCILCINSSLLDHSCSAIGVVFSRYHMHTCCRNCFSPLQNLPSWICTLRTYCRICPCQKMCAIKYIVYYKTIEKKTNDIVEICQPCWKFSFHLYYQLMVWFFYNNRITGYMTFKSFLEHVGILKRFMHIRTLIDMNKHIHTTLFTLNISKLICKMSFA